MATKFCGHPSCGAKITYSGIPPKICPRCERPLAAAFASVASAPTPSQRSPETRYQQQPAPAYTGARLRDKPTTARLKPSPNRPALATYAHSNEEPVQSNPNDEFGYSKGDRGQSDHIDYEEKAMLVDELTAMMENAGVGDLQVDDERPVTFGSLVRQAEASKGSQ